MSYTKLDVQAIGSQANQVLQRNSSAEVYGTSSKGIYLQTANDLTLFVSFEDFQGPLTINFMGDPEKLSKVKPRTIANINGNHLVFPGAELELSIKKAEIWSPVDPPKFTGLKKNQIDDLYLQTKLLVGENPFFPLLEMVLKSTAAPLPGFPEFYKRMKFLIKSIQSGAASNLAWEAENLIGAGPGLTPLGDDLILGILIAINRGKRSFYTESYLKQLNQAVIDLALDKTTRLSFSLLVCAADGSADQRLLKVFDGLLAGIKIKDEELLQMLTWGSTSGFAVLAGMVLALNEGTVSDLPQDSVP